MGASDRRPSSRLSRWIGKETATCKAASDPADALIVTCAAVNLPVSFDVPCVRWRNRAGGKRVEEDSNNNGLFSVLNISLNASKANEGFLVHECFTQLYLYVFDYIYIYMYIHTYLHAYIPTYIQTNIHTYIHTYRHTYIQTYVHTYVHTYIHACMHACIHTDKHTYTPMAGVNKRQRPGPRSVK